MRDACIALTDRRTRPDARVAWQSERSGTGGARVTGAWHMHERTGWRIQEDSKQTLNPYATEEFCGLAVRDDENGDQREMGERMSARRQ